MGIKRRFKVKIQQRWKRRQARRKLAKKAPIQTAENQPGQQVPPAQS